MFRSRESKARPREGLEGKERTGSDKLRRDYCDDAELVTKSLGKSGARLRRRTEQKIATALDRERHQEGVGQGNGTREGPRVS